MKKVKLKFVGFWDDFDPKDNIFMTALRKRFDVDLDDEPDYIICSVFGLGFYEYVNYDCPRIFYSGENYSPDFNVFDYCMGFDDLCYGDRYLRYPMYLLRFSAPDAASKHLDITGDTLSDKTEFCNYIYGDRLAQPERERLFHLLDGYKRVLSAGSHLNNMDGFTVRLQDSKLDFQRKFKFTIAVESCSLRGFVTEKIVDAFAAKTIPVYFGDPDIGKTFNEKAFVNVRALGGFEKALERVKQIDCDDELFLSLLREPAFLEDDYLQKHNAAFESFLYNIFDQEPKDAYRRASKTSGQALIHENYLKKLARFLPSKAHRNLTMLDSYADKYLRRK